MLIVSMVAPIGKSLRLGKYFIIEMPVNEDGNGPEMDPDKVVKIYYEIWDENYLTHGSYDSREEAEDAMETFT